MGGVKKKSWLGRVVKLGLLLLLAVVALCYFQRDRLVEKVFEIAGRRLAEQGLYIEHGSHQVSWRGGVVLRDLSLFADKEKQKRLAYFSNLRMRVALLELLDDDGSLILSSERGLLRIETAAGNVEFSDLNLKLLCTGEVLDIKEFECGLDTLKVTAEGKLYWGKGSGESAGGGGDSEGSGEGAVDVLKIPDLSPLVNVVSWLGFSKGEPTLALQINSADVSGSGIDLSGELSGRDLVWRGVALDRAKVQLGLAEGAVVISAADLDCYGGNVSGGLVIDYQKGELELRELVSSADPFRFVDAVMRKDSLKSFALLGKTKLSGDGVVFDLKEFSRSRGTLVVDSPGGISIPVKGASLPLIGFRGEAEFAEGKLQVDGKQFSLHGGAGSGSFEMPLSGPFQYKLKVKTEGVSMVEMGRSFGLENDLAGTWNMSFDGGGGSGLATHYGSGVVKVQDGDFYAVPFVGAFRAFISGKVAGYRGDHAGDLSATLSLKRGVLSSSDLLVESEGSKVMVKGGVDLVNESLSVDVRMNLKGVVGLATGVVSRILEVHGEGPLDEVKWSMMKVPDVVGGVTDVATEGVKSAVDGVGGLIDGVGKATGKLLEKRPKLPGFKKEKPE